MAINPPPDQPNPNPPAPPAAPPEPPAPPAPDPRIGELEAQVARGRQMETILRTQVELALSPEQGALLEQANLPVDQIRPFAERLKATAPQPAAGGQPVGEPPARGGAPNPPSNVTTQPEPAEEREYRQTADQLRDPLMRPYTDPDKVRRMAGNRRQPGAAWINGWNQHMEDRRTGRSSVGPGNQ